MLKYEARFNIASIIFSVKTNESKPIGLLTDAYTMYLSDEKPELKINIYYNSDNPHLPKYKLLSRNLYNIYIDKSSSVDFSVYTKKSYIGIGDIIRFLTSFVLIKKEGLLLHSCGAKINNDAYLLLGPSGSGKTTAAKLLPDKYKLLSDETTAIIKNHSGYYAYATPFFGDFGRVTLNNKGILRAILFLKQSRQFCHKQLEIAAATNKILQNIFFIKDCLNYDMLNRAMDISFGIAKKIPCYEFEFLPDKNIWKYIRNKICHGA